MAHFLLSEDSTFLLQEDGSSMILLDGNFVEVDEPAISTPLTNMAVEIETVGY